MCQVSIRHWYTTLNKMVRSLPLGASRCCPHALTPTPMKNGYSAVSLDSRTGHLEGKDVAKGVKRGSQASRMEGLLGGEHAHPQF